MNYNYLSFSILFLLINADSYLVYDIFMKRTEWEHMDIHYKIYKKLCLLSSGHMDVWINMMNYTNVCNGKQQVHGYQSFSVFLNGIICFNCHPVTDKHCCYQKC